MKNIKLFHRAIIAVAILLFCNNFKSKGQSITINNPFEKTRISHKPFHYAPFPFDSVIVLDNRNDTSTIQINENGKYPVETLNFSEPAPIAIRNYIRVSEKGITLGNKKIVLINIKHLRGANKNYFIKKDKTKKGKVVDYLGATSNHIFLSADVYLQTRGSNFRKFITINDTYTPSYYFDHFSVKKLIDELMDAITLFYSDSIIPKPKEPYRFKRDITEKNHIIQSIDTAEVSIADIEMATKSYFTSFPILKASITETGIYPTFEEFRDNIITKETLKLGYNASDSTDTLYAELDNATYRYHYPYAIADSGKLFMQLYDNKYVELTKVGNTFYFDVPRSLRNMYSILSGEKLDIEKSNNYYGGGLLGTALILGSEALQRSKISKMEKERMDNGEYRHCIIDMINGDFIY